MTHNKPHSRRLKKLRKGKTVSGVITELKTLTPQQRNIRAGRKAEDFGKGRTAEEQEALVKRETIAKRLEKEIRVKTRKARVKKTSAEARATPFIPADPTTEQKVSLPQPQLEPTILLEPSPDPLEAVKLGPLDIAKQNAEIMRTGSFTEKLLLYLRFTPVGSGAVVNKVGQGTLFKVNSAAAGKTIPLSGSAARDAAAGFPGARIAVNTKNFARSKAWLTKLVAKAKEHPLLTLGAGLYTVQQIVKGINDIIGQYNFAGFIKEEALQTVGFASSQAVSGIENKIRFKLGEVTPEEIDFARRTLAYEKELLEPSIWTGIIDATPQKKMIDNLKDFSTAAELALEGKINKLNTAVETLGLGD